jgi:hypothetical protein
VKKPASVKSTSLDASGPQTCDGCGHVHQQVLLSNDLRRPLAAAGLFCFDFVEGLRQRCA